MQLNLSSSGMLYRIFKILRSQLYVSLYYYYLFIHILEYAWVVLIDLFQCGRNSNKIDIHYSQLNERYLNHNAIFMYLEDELQG